MGSIGQSEPNTVTHEANLKSIVLASLLAGDEQAAEDLVQACKTHGFFYLDFRQPSTSAILQEVDELAEVGKSVFNRLSLEEKEEYSTEKYLPSRLLGYKRAGCSVGPFAKKHDGYESFSIHNNGVFGSDPLVVPRAIDDNLSIVKSFMSRVHSYTDIILSILSEALDLPSNLKDSHRKDAPSSANMAMLNYLPWGTDPDRIGNMAHTDMGTLTVVFSKNPGLQALLPGDEEWSYILPRSGHAVVNVGDSLRFLSRNQLKSSLHRVVPPADGEDAKDKFSVIYFLRPEFDAKFELADGRVIRSVEWHNQKYALFREASLDAETHGAMLTGRQGFLGATAGKA